jgi:hypothetical protein
MPASGNPMTEAHEERIFRLEDSMQKVLTSTTATAVKMDNLAEKIEQGFTSVHQRLDKGVAQFDQHEAALADHGREITRFKEAEARARRRWGLIKKAVFPLLAASAAVIATRFGENIWIWIVSLVH